MRDFNLETLETTAASGLDAFFEQEPQVVGLPPKQAKERPQRRQVASLRDLAEFKRVAADTLIHKATRDFWALKPNGDGTYQIERLIDGNGPVKEG
jgi:hypothetical protein